MSILTHDDALNTLRELADGVRRLEEHFKLLESQPSEPISISTVARESDADNGATLEKNETPLCQIQEQISAAERRAVEAEERAEKTESRLNEAKLLLQDVETRHKEILEQLAQDNEALSALKEALRKAEEIIASSKQHETVEEELAEKRTQIEAEAAKLEQRAQVVGVQEASVDAWRKAADAANYLKEQLCPHWLRAGSLSEWEEKLEVAIATGVATSTAALLFAAIHGYTAATRDADPKLLHDSLREISRRLFAWFKENGLNQQDAVETAGLWAVEINRECHANAEVEIPSIGAPATNQWMIFRPRPGVNSPDVESVQTWCVRDARRIPVHRAEITV
ncbi:MAG: hypothetical protein WCK17_02050 [Verrucomicrobiota bacterium]